MSGETFCVILVAAFVLGCMLEGGIHRCIHRPRNYSVGKRGRGNGNDQ